MQKEPLHILSLHAVTCSEALAINKNTFGPPWLQDFGRNLEKRSYFCCRWLKNRHVLSFSGLFNELAKLRSYEDLY